MNFSALKRIPMQAISMLRRMATCAVMVLALANLPARAGDNGIEVAGTGEALARPNQIEIDLTAAATAELTGDAIVKYQDSLRRTLDAFERLEMQNLEVVQRDLTISSGGGPANAAMAVVLGGAGNAPAAKPQMNISRSLRLVLTGIQDLSEDELVQSISTLLDTAQDAGAAVGQGTASNQIAMMMGQAQGGNSVVRFVVEGADELREQAYQQAFAQAKARANRLAKLAGSRLGQVLAVEEVAVEAADDKSSMQQQMLSAIYGVRSSSDDGETRLTSDKLGDIPIRVSLRVRFAIQGASDGSAAPDTAPRENRP